MNTNKRIKIVDKWRVDRCEGLVIKWKSDADTSPRSGLNEIPNNFGFVLFQMHGIKKRSEERKDVFLLVHQFC